MSLEKEAKEEFCDELYYLLKDAVGDFRRKVDWRIEHILNQFYPLLQDLKMMYRSGQYEILIQTVLELENLWSNACCSIPNFMYQAAEEAVKDKLEYEMGRKEFSRITKLLKLAREVKE
jgi:hypothetical protein